MVEAQKQDTSHYKYVPDVIIGDEDDEIRKKEYRIKSNWEHLPKAKESSPIPGWLFHIFLVAACGSVGSFVLWTFSHKDETGQVSIIKSREIKAGSKILSGGQEPLPKQGRAASPPAQTKLSEKPEKKERGWVNAKRTDGVSKRTDQKDDPALGGTVEKRSERRSESSPEPAKSGAGQGAERQDATSLQSRSLVTEKPALSKTSALEVSVLERQESSKPQKKNVLQSIRSDPRRIYLDKSFVVGDLIFEIRNVSEHGIELYVKNSEDARQTYYFPKVTVDDAVSQFELTVLFPGGESFGWVVMEGLRKKQDLELKFSVVGGKERKEKVKLKW